jgi:AraC family transcriptional regulator, regulatory protein of adaptative response / methylated-DNA-[protein]-cysteine methyltransferase
MTVTVVSTTGIFCRPECSASPLPGHVRPFDGARSALFAGFRPCRRCRPMASAVAPEWARAAVDTVEHDPDRPRTVRELANAAGTAPEALERWMRSAHGMTVAEYLRARRLSPVVGAARMARRRTHGRDRVVITLLETPLGPMLAGTTDAGICLLEFTDRPMLPTQLRTVQRLHGPLVAGRHAHLDRLAAQLEEYFAGARAQFDLPLDVPGSTFQRTIWDGLLRVPYGTTTTYAELAAMAGRPGAARAVGRANGSNRVAIVIPCHRVVAAGGGLGGYGGGLDRKRALLELESVTGGGPAIPA